MLLKFVKQIVEVLTLLKLQCAFLNLNQEHPNFLSLDFEDSDILKIYEYSLVLFIMLGFELYTLCFIFDLSWTLFLSSPRALVLATHFITIMFASMPN